MQVSSSK